jgi:hypothetical protein
MLLDIGFSVSGRRQDHTNQIFHFLPSTGSFFRYAYHRFLQERPILSLDDLHRSRAFFLVVRHVIDAGTKARASGSQRIETALHFFDRNVFLVRRNRPCAAKWIEDASFP